MTVPAGTFGRRTGQHLAFPNPDRQGGDPRPRTWQSASLRSRFRNSWGRRLPTSRPKCHAPSGRSGPPWIATRTYLARCHPAAGELYASHQSLPSRDARRLRAFSSMRFLFGCGPGEGGPSQGESTPKVGVAPWPVSSSRASSGARSSSSGLALRKTSARSASDSDRAFSRSNVWAANSR